MSTRSIVVISAGVSQPSSTRLLADRLAKATVTALADLGQQSQVTAAAGAVSGSGARWIRPPSSSTG